MNEIYCGDIRDIAKTLSAQSVNCIVTSPPYFGLRDYGVDKQIGLEETPEAYVDTLVGIFRELKRVLRDDGTLFLNLGDSYGTGTKAQRSNGSRGISHATQQAQDTMPRLGGMAKQLLGIPWRVAFALQADGWILRSDIIWHKKNPMPESVKDRPTKSHEYIFLLSKKPRYYYDNEAVREAQVDDEKTFYAKLIKTSHKATKDDPKLNGLHRTKGGLHKAKYNPQGRNRRSVWSVSTRPFRAAHFAVFPPDLIRPCILAGCPQQVCVECGEPWVRVVENIGMAKHHGTNKTYQKDAKGQHGKTSVFITGQTPKSQTTGFEPVCGCNAGTTSGVVLDPFIGSGTVAQVAIETGRNWLGVELNPEYIELANKRIAQTQSPLPMEITL